MALFGPLFFDTDKGELVRGFIAPTTLILSANAITITQLWHRVSATGTLAQRSVRTINGGVVGQLLILEADPASPDDPVIDDNAGNIRSAGDFVISSVKHKIGFIYDGTEWCELFRSYNG